MLDKILKGKYKLQEYLFDKGFLITDSLNVNSDDFPFYGNWKIKIRINKYNVYAHKNTAVFSTNLNDDYSAVLFGHCYNPYTNQYNENEILDELVSCYRENNAIAGTLLKKINQLTGIFALFFFNKNKIDFLNDCSGMQYVCYGKPMDTMFIASHMQLIGDICNLNIDPYVERLINYRWYHYLMGNYLPGDMTRFKEIKHVIPNVFVRYDGDFSLKRFYPSMPIKQCETNDEYEKVLNEAAGILKNTMLLISKKWSRPAISLTGGIDSNTTFAAANGIYDKFQTFSYVSMQREIADAKAAKTISEHFCVPFKEYSVPQTNNEIPDFEIYKLIFEHNDGNIGSYKDDDTRKKITLIHNDVCQVEIKSWISETIRAYAYKYYGKKHFPKSLKARNYSAMYKIFMFNRPLLWQTDKQFKDYIKKTDLKSHVFNYDETDLFVWEMMHGGKCALNIGVMKSCFDIDIPYNNRKLLDLLLRVPLEYRINDKLHLDLKQLLNKKLFDMNIRVQNENQSA